MFCVYPAASATASRMRDRLRMEIRSPSRACSARQPAHGNKARHDIGHQLLVFLGKIVQQLLRFGVRQQVGHVVLDHFGQMRGDHGGRVDDSIAAERGFLAQGPFDPHGRQPERGLGGLLSRQGDLLAARVHRHEHTRPQLTLAGFDLANADQVRVRAELHVVENAHRRPTKPISPASWRRRALIWSVRR